MLQNLWLFTFEASTAHNVAHHQECTRRPSTENKNRNTPEVPISWSRFPRDLTAKHRTFE